VYTYPEGYLTYFQPTMLDDSEHASGTYAQLVNGAHLRQVLAILRDFGLDKYIANDNVPGVAKDCSTT
jgi:hypothetical protein